MLHKDARRAERRWRSHHVWMRRLREDWATHGWNWNYLWTRPAGFYRIRESCSIWAETTLCECFYDPSFKGMGRFKDTPTMGHSKRVSNGKDGERINEYKAERFLEVDRESYGTTERRRKRMEHRLRPNLKKVTCRCGYLVGHVMIRPGEDRYSATSRKFGKKLPKCPNCEERRNRTLMVGSDWIATPA